MKKNRDIIVGVLLFLLSLLLSLTGLDFDKTVAIATLLMMSYWWITSCVSAAITAVVPIIVNAVFALTDMSGVISYYASETAVLLFGCDIMALCWSITGLDKRLSLWTISMIGTSLQSHIVVWFLLSAALSCFLPNVVVCAVLLPILVSMLEYIGEKDFSGNGKSSVGAKLMICVVWGAELGGIGTPLGGSMNMIAIEHIESQLGREYLFSEWLTRFFPLMLLLLLVCIIVLLLQNREKEELNGSKAFFAEEYRKMQPMSLREKISLSVFLMAVILSFSRGLYADCLCFLKPAYIFLIAGFILLIVPVEGKPIIDWKYCESHMFWGTIFMFSGGMALGKLIIDTGVCQMVSEMLWQSGMGCRTMLILIVMFTMFLSEISNNTSAAAIAIPLAEIVFSGSDMTTLTYLTPICLAYNCSFLLPTTVRAMAVGYGLSPGFLMKKGIPASMAVFITICIISLHG